MCKNTWHFAHRLMTYAIRFLLCSFIFLIDICHVQIDKLTNPSKNKSARSVDALAVKKGESLSDNLKSRDASASKKT